MASYMAKTLGLMPYVVLRYVSCKMLTQSLNTFDAYITNSNFLRKVVLNNLGLNAEDVHTVYNAVDMEQFNLDAEVDSGKILYAGRFDIGKGIEYVIGAIPQVLKMYDNCTFVFAGDGAIRKKMKTLARELRVSRHVIFKGFVPYSEISECYKRCDIVVAPSVWPEPFGRSLIEAMACGKPIVTTKVGGISEVVEDGTTGLLVEPANSGEIANAITTLLGNEEMRMKMGRRGREVVEEKYNAEATARKVLMVYENVLDTAGRVKHYR